MTSSSPLGVLWNSDQLALLRELASSRTAPLRRMRRAHVALHCARGTANAVVARMLRLHLDTVRRWRKRFTAERLAALEDRPRPGRPRRYGGEVHSAIVATVTGASRLVPAARGCALTGKAPPGDLRQSGRRAGWPS
ncbi:helix-turn-helix domain-containing protein [Streptomyces sp. NPDC001743]|uniref:helix-turn-helix domain-containing protein n=1 Tax=Streptomyces sp. NPDC001743 TaxID=3154397 RepID=UPI0033208135